MNKMETNDNDLWRNLFDAMPDETAPEDLHAKVMHKIHEKTALSLKKRRYWGIFGIASGFAVMLITAVIAFYNMDISFRLPELNPSVWSFPTIDSGLFQSPSFGLSLQVGVLALLLLIADSTIRRRIEKEKPGK